MRADTTVAVVFRNDPSVKCWFHNYGDLVQVDHRFLGDKLYRDENGGTTLLKFFRVDYEKDVHQMAGLLFDKVIMLDKYSDQTVSWLKSREQRKSTMRVIRESKFKGQIWKGECQRCDAIFECDLKEIQDKIKMPTSVVSTSDDSEYAHIDCTECGQKNVKFRFDRNLVKPPTDGGLR